MKQCTCTPTDLMPFGDCVCGDSGSGEIFDKEQQKKLLSEVMKTDEEYGMYCERMFTKDELKNAFTAGWLRAMFGNYPEGHKEHQPDFTQWFAKNFNESTNK